MWWNDGWSWWTWLSMGVGMVVLWGLIVWAVIWAVRNSAGQNTHQDDPQTILDRRFARGEIDEQEYRARCDALATNRRPTPYAKV
jgi:putative membrane protein